MLLLVPLLPLPQTVQPLTDQLGRPLRDLRLSVTDRCNLRCTYCMPGEIFGPEFAFLPRSELLSFEELERLSRLFVAGGVDKLRITGGEPLLRKGLPELIARLAAIEGVRDIAMTTNGLLLPRLAQDLKAAGLKRVTVSLDSLDPEVFGRMNGLGVHPDKVLDGIEAALQAGLGVKINTVVQRGVNEQSLGQLWHALKDKAVLRFIEFMDVGNHNGWNLDAVVPPREVLAQLGGDFRPAQAQYRGEVASRYVDEQGHEAGLITSVSAPFCGDCTRARLSAVGVLYTCLFATGGLDLRAPLRDGASDEQLAALLAQTWTARTDRYSEERGEATAHDQSKQDRPKVEMSHIGG
jgi:GTP 3',8-cyclase